MRDCQACSFNLIRKINETRERERLALNHLSRSHVSFTFTLPALQAERSLTFTAYRS